jgi:lipoyl(octanoyl) transferase
MEMRPSAKGNYMSLTCTIRAVSREQLDALYRELSAASAGQGRAVSGIVVQRRLGETDFSATWRAMQRLHRRARRRHPRRTLAHREHPPVFTQGQGGKPEHLLRDIGIPVVKIDRGGQITYHGPGQLVVYLLLDLRGAQPQGARAGLAHRAGGDRSAGRIRHRGERLAGAPGVYVGGAKIAALGLRVSNGCCYHGVALNVDMELAPFTRRSIPAATPG